VWRTADIGVRATTWLAVLASGFLVIGCGGDSASKAGVGRSAERTLRLFEYNDCCGGFQPVPFAQRADTPGFAYLADNGVTDADGKKVGRFYTSCTLESVPVRPRTDPGSLCAYYFILRDGQFVAEGAASDQIPWTVPIIGGTGTYLGARGSITTVGVTRIGYSFVVHLH
jgi:hypothetical protein